MIRFTPPDGRLDLADTLDCGQAFRWVCETAQDGREIWRGAAFGKALALWAEDGTFCFDCSETDFREIWFDYFDFGTDYARLQQEIASAHPLLKSAVEFAPGIRVLRQEPWEALCSFIVSQCNNIPRIKGILARLCAAFGDELAPNVFSFPSAQKLAGCSPTDLEPMRAGFRAKYILEAAKRTAGGTLDLEQLKNLPTCSARAILCTLPGVGNKVADCALLYGLHKTDCCPVDVWMKRVLAALAPLTPEDLGETAGIAQQYLFNYARSNFSEEKLVKKL